MEEVEGVELKEKVQGLVVEDVDISDDVEGVEVEDIDTEIMILNERWKKWKVWS